MPGLGVVELLYGDRGLIAVGLGTRGVERAVMRLRAIRVVCPRCGEGREPPGAVRHVLGRFAEGEPVDPASLEVELWGTEFQRAVYAHLRTIPRGQVRSYGEVARLLGNPGAAQAVGAANRANPSPLAVPCHRVVAANGSPGGFSGGLELKLRLLKLEGVDRKGWTPSRQRALFVEESPSSLGRHSPVARLSTPGG